MALFFLWLIAVLATVGRCYVIVDVGLAPPQFATPPTWPQSDYYDEDGPPITLACRLTSLVGVSLLWYRDGALLERGNDLLMRDRNQTVTLEVPKQSQTGTYMCWASNAAGSVNHTGYIYISARQQETRPRIVGTDPESLVKHADIGDNITITCEFDVGGTDLALMDLTNSWMRNNTEVEDNNHTTYDLNVTESKNQVLSLAISNLQVSDYGEYVCYGKNSLGNDSRTIAIFPKVPNKGHFPVYAIVGASVGSVFVIGTIVMVVLAVRRRHQWNKYEELEWQEPDVSNFQVPTHNVEYDVFISYSSNDLDWVKGVLFDHLVAKGYNVCIDFKDFTPGMAISENIIDAIYKSRHTIVLLSKNFLRSMWGQFELQQAHNRAVMLRQDALILIKFDQSKVPVKLMGKTFLDWSDLKVRPHFWQRLLEAIGEPSHFEGINNDLPNEPQIYVPDTLEDIEPELVEYDPDETDSEDNADKELHDSGIGQEFPTDLLQENVNENNRTEHAHINQDDINKELLVLTLPDNDVDMHPNNNNKDVIENANNFENTIQGELENLVNEGHKQRAKSDEHEVNEPDESHKHLNVDDMIEVH